jgi:PhzF family phenazine biosynthesis protein
MKQNKEITEFRIFQVNAFVEMPYQGNPAGVCLLPQERDDDYYRKVAIKMGLSETAFIIREGNTFKLRWFTRGGSEVDLCGHATLASAYILWKKRYISQAETIRFQTRSGVLSAKSDGEYVTLGFPLEEIAGVKYSEYDFEKLMGLTPVYTGRTRFDYLLVVDSEKAVKYLAPDFEKLKKIQTRGIMVTAKSESAGYDFISRFFAPSVGVNEDPVTGSAHTVLGIYWGQVLKKKRLIGYQASKEGGIVRVEVLKDGVLLSGQAQEVPISKELQEAIRSVCLADRLT